MQTVFEMLEREGMLGKDKDGSEGAKVEAIRSFFSQIGKSDPSLKDLADAYLSARHDKDIAEQNFSNRKAVLRAVELTLLNKMEDEGVKSHRTDAGLFSKKDMVYPSVKDKEDLINWAIENDWSSQLIEMSIVKSGATDLCKKAIMGEVELPDSIVYWIKQSISFRKEAPDPKKVLDNMRMGVDSSGK